MHNSFITFSLPLWLYCISLLRCFFSRLLHISFEILWFLYIYVYIFIVQIILINELMFHDVLEYEHSPIFNPLFCDINLTLLIFIRLVTNKITWQLWLKRANIFCFAEKKTRQNTAIRPLKKYKIQMSIDTDDGNASL